MQRKKKTTSESYNPSTSFQLSNLKKKINYDAKHIHKDRPRKNTNRHSKNSSLIKKQKPIGSLRNMTSGFGVGKSSYLKFKKNIFEEYKSKHKRSGNKKYTKPYTTTKLNSNRNISISQK